MSAPKDYRIRFALPVFLLYEAWCFYDGFIDYDNSTVGGFMYMFWGALKFVVLYAFFSWLAGEKEDNSPPVV